MKTLGWILFIIALAIIFYIYQKKTPNSTVNKIADSNKITCELKDVNGKTITITGTKDDEQFKKMCQLQASQPVYVYGYPYIFYRTRRHDTTIEV